MSKETQIGIAITTRNRYDFTIASFENVLNDGRVNSVTIVDDASDDGSAKMLEQTFKYHPKIKLFENSQTLGVYRNKHLSVSLSTENWLIVFDSDNVLDTDYIDTIFALPDWDEKTFYCPDFAKPALSYEHFAGVTITKENAGNYIDQRNGLSLANTMNFFCNRQRYMDIYKPDEEPVAADSILINYLNLINDGKMYIVPNLSYIHSIHPGSHYVNYTHKSDIYHKQITDKIRMMK